MQADVCTVLHVYHAYFLLKFVHVSDFRLIKSKREAAKYV